LAALQWSWAQREQLELAKADWRPDGKELF
jgi:hypothetical protein